MCKKTIQLGIMGHKALDSHTQAEKHKRYVASQATSLPIRIFTSPVEPRATSQPSTSPGNAVGSFANVDTLKAEILWVLQTIRNKQLTLPHNGGKRHDDGQTGFDHLSLAFGSYTVDLTQQLKPCDTFQVYSK